MHDTTLSSPQISFLENMPASWNWDCRGAEEVPSLAQVKDLNVSDPWNVKPSPGVAQRDSKAFLSFQCKY